MATSGSTSGWVAGARIFSGRPDPTWEVPEEEAERIVSVWERLPPAREPAKDSPALGYRGCWLRARDERWWDAVGGVVTSGGDARADVGGSVERAILATAPDDALPAGFAGE
jgi:hypothetical protein